AQALRDAGLQRVTVSLDALDDAVFGRINDAGFKVADVLRGIEAAQHAGLTPIKINMVVQRGVNDSQIIPMARHFRRTGATLRFIEYMDVGGSNGWRMEQVVPSNEVLSRLAAIYPLQAVPAQTPGETATRWRYADGQGEIGLISSVSHAFCGDCNRVRLSAEGRLFTCLFAHRGHDLRTLLRDRHTDESIKDSITGIWQQRHDRYSESRGHAPLQARVTEPRVEMHYVGG
ncbi:MAG: GTP 3',8-cyclase MoaA, partial [Burkholderiaceae bacterium]